MTSRLPTILFLSVCIFQLNVRAEWDSPLFGQIKTSASASATYDSRVFGIPSSYYNQLKTNPGSNNAGVPVNELKSEDDFILKFSPSFLGWSHILLHTLWWWLVLDHFMYCKVSCNRIHSLKRNSQKDSLAHTASKQTCIRM